MRVPTQAVINRALRMHRPRVAVSDGSVKLTYGELDDSSARLASVLVQLGASAERPAALYVPNCAEFIVVDVACQRAGITRVGIGERLAADEARYIVGHSRAAVLVTTPELLEKLDLTDLDVEPLVVGDGYEQALAAADPLSVTADVEPDAWSYILYTSGTTGRPKGAAHTHGSRAAGMFNMLSGELSLDSNSVFVHAAPLTHGSGSKILSVLACGGENFVMPRFTPEAMAEAVERGGTHTFLVPTMLARLLGGGETVVDAVQRLRHITFGGSPIASVSFKRAIDSFGPILTQIYGTSEAPHPLALLKPSDYCGRSGEELERVLTSAGRPSLMTDVRIVDDSGDEVAPGETGELLARGPHLMRGYWRDSEATQASFRRGEWYATGDLATMADDQLIAFVDRKKDLIISGGLNIYPSEVERVLMEHPGVGEVAVVGGPDPEWGEVVVAYVVKRDPEVGADALIAWSRERLASYKKPKRIVFLESFPLGSSNKVLKRHLRDALWAGEARKVG